MIAITKIAAGVEHELKNTITNVTLCIDIVIEGLQSHFTCDKLCRFSKDFSSLTPLASGAFLEGEPNISFLIVHPGSVEPLRVAPAEPVV